MVSFITSSPLAVPRNVTLSNGVRLHYIEQGPANGPVLLMLHGYSDSSFSFSRVMPLMRPDWRVIAPDLRGHGESDRPPLGYRPADFADDVIRLMDTLQIPSAVIAGHSMGSFVARKVCDLAPDRVTKLILIGAAPVCDNAVARELLSVVETLTDPVDQQFVRDFQLSTMSVPVPPAFLDAVCANSERMPARIWKAALRGLIENPIRTRPEVPALVIGGREDAVFSAAEQELLATQCPNATLELFGGVGHTVHWEQPIAFVHALNRFGL
jgi:non-heme chloroperoxidase